MTKFQSTSTYFFFIVLCLFLCNAFSTKAQQVKTGIEQLQRQDFEVLKRKRIGLITNPTGVDSNLRSTVDILFEADSVNLVVLFAPEHGVRGDFYAGDRVADARDSRTNLPVFSLYGKTRKPTKGMLKDIDILVYDIQDIGSRSYTYISTMGLAMEAAAENNIEFIVLDRPNPLGGVKMEGAITRKGFFSFVGQFPIPYIHGLTSGELAMFLNREKLLKNGIQCKLTVVMMDGWKREMQFPATGLPWVPSSPHIPRAESAYFYPISGIVGEFSLLNIGVGYTLPFELFAASWIDNPDTLALLLNNLQIPGILFRPIHYKPYYGNMQGQHLKGVQVHLVEYGKAPLTLIQFYVLQELYKLYPHRNIFEESDASRLNMFDKVCGTDEVRKQFTKRFLVEDILFVWNNDVDTFREKTKPYLLYK